MGGVETIDMPQTGVTCVSGGGAIYVNLLGFQFSATKVNFEIFLRKI